MPKTSRPQEFLSSHGHLVPKYTKGQMFTRNARHKLIQKIKEGKVKLTPKATKKAKEEPKSKTLTFKNKSGVEKKRIITPRVQRIPTTPSRRRVVNTKNTTKPTKLRKSLTPGTVLILLAGRFSGRRVVFLGQLPSGLLLVTGPFKINGVPLRRVNQRYVIATSTKVDTSSFDAKSVNDSHFQKKKEIKKKVEPKTETLFAKKEETKIPLSEEFKKLQATVDEPLLSAVKKVEHLEQYLKANFNLKRGK